MKRAVKRTAGWAASLEAFLSGRRAAGGACVFYYHRIADVRFVDGGVDDWNVRPETFARQVAALCEFAEIVPLLELPRRLRSSAPRGRPLVALTFDDGYASFHRHALPVLKRHGAHATAFVVTSTIGADAPQPFDAWALKNSGRAQADDWRAMNWEELEDCAASGLVHVGAHSHQHLRGSRCAPSQLAEEAARSREILRARLGGAHALAYAYPYGSTMHGDASPAYAEAVRAAGYKVAVTTDLGLVAESCDPLMLPRVEAHALDAPGVIRAKASGALASYRLTDKLRLLSRAV